MVVHSANLLLCLTLLAGYSVAQEQNAPGPDVPQLIRRLHTGSWLDRNHALDQIIPYVSQSQAAQKALIDICSKLGANPDWEDDNFIRYSDQVSHIVASIAQKTEDPAAWNALAVSSYNEDSPYARWLSAQEGAVHVLTRELDDEQTP